MVRTLIIAGRSLGLINNIGYKKIINFRHVNLDKSFIHEKYPNLNLL